MKVVLLGYKGYVGSCFARRLEELGLPFHGVSRDVLDYTSFEVLLDFLQRVKPAFLINAAGTVGYPNVDACETRRAETLLGNAILPQVVSAACAVISLPWAQVSSGCIYNGAWLRQEGIWTVEPDLTSEKARRILRDHPEEVRGFSEIDAPNFSFRMPPCSFYSGTKALGEEVLEKDSRCYVWRLRIPFDGVDGPRNYLSKIMRYEKVYDNFNSVSHTADYVSACLSLWQRGAPFGVYNVTNPGHVSTRQVVSMIERILKPRREFAFWKDDEEFYRQAARTPRSNCILDTSKLLAAGIRMRPVEEALEDALHHWHAAA
jgi:UDP-glucose 4,6-dehydratase